MYIKQLKDTTFRTAHDEFIRSSKDEIGPLEELVGELEKIAKEVKEKKTCKEAETHAKSLVFGSEMNKIIVKKPHLPIDLHYIIESISIKEDSVKVFNSNNKPIK